MKRLTVIFLLVFAITFAAVGCTLQLAPNERKPAQTQSKQTPPSTQKPAGQNPESSPDTPSTLLPKEAHVKIYLIALNDNGKTGKEIGTGDSLVAVDKTISAPQTPLKAAFEELLAMKEPYYGNTGLYNALYRANLKLDKATITNGKAEIHLTGSLSLGGIMDNPRAESQLTETAFQFSNVKEVQIYLNGKTLKDALSLK